jgi:hypothetical protein
LLTLDTGAERLAGLNERFIGFYSDGKAMNASAVPVDPTLPLELYPDIFDLTDGYYTHPTNIVPLDDGLFLAFTAPVQVEGSEGFLPELFGVLLDASLAVRAAPVHLFGLTWSSAAVSDGEQVLVVSATEHDGEQRLSARTVTVEEGDPPTDTSSDSEADSASEIDSTEETDTDADTDTAGNPDSEHRDTDAQSRYIAASGCAVTPPTPAFGRSLLEIAAAVLSSRF